MTDLTGLLSQLSLLSSLSLVHTLRLHRKLPNFMEELCFRGPGDLSPLKCLAGGALLGLRT